MNMSEKNSVRLEGRYHRRTSSRFAVPGFHEDVFNRKQGTAGEAREHWRMAFQIW
jgi:hypothetical protein